MLHSLSSQVDITVKVLHKVKCKNCKSDLEYLTVKGPLLTLKYSKKNYEVGFDMNLARRLGLLGLLTVFIDFFSGL